jgi:hypothetical protein
MQSLLWMCISCGVVKLNKPVRQGRIMKYHPRMRFELVAVDVLEMKPVTRSGSMKIVVIGFNVQSIYHGSYYEG